MSVIRVNKTSNYTVISNYHLKEKDMSLKAIGLLTKMLSLPEDWDYSINGLVSICKENKTAIRNTLKELEEFGYLKVTKIKNEVGQFEYIYDIFEKPEHKNPGTENLDLDDLYLENRTQLNTNKSNTKKLNTNISYKEKYKKENFESDTITTNFQNFPVEGIKKEVVENQPQNQYIPINNFRDIIEPPKEKVNTGKVTKEELTKIEKLDKKTKHKYGEYQNVLLTDEELAKLKTEFPNDFEIRIEQLSEYIEIKAPKYKNHLAVIRAWARKDAEKIKAIEANYSFSVEQYENDEPDFDALNRMLEKQPKRRT